MAKIDHAREVREVVLRHFAAAVDSEVVITRSTPIDDLELDSLTLVETSTRIQDELAVDLPLEQFLIGRTVGEVIDALDEWLFGDSAAEPRQRAKPALPDAIRLEGEGKSASEYVSDGRR